MKRALVFGVFDGLHEGHRYFLREAKKQCEELFVVVATDEVVRVIKGKLPKHSYAERAGAILAFDASLKMIPSDSELGSWNVLDAIKPDLVILGYDQREIAEELKKRGVPFLVLDSYRPDEFKSSLLNGH